MLKNINGSQKIVLIFIAIFLLLSIGIVVILLNFNVKDNNTYNNSIIKNETISQNILISNEITDSKEYDWSNNLKIENKNKLKNVSNKSDYFTIKYLNINYINLIGNQKAEELINIISPSYLNTYKLTKENILSTFNNIPMLENETQYYRITISEMLTVTIDNSREIFFINSIVRNMGNNKTTNVKAMFELNLENNTYNIYPEKYIIDKGYSNIKSGDYINIELNENVSAQTKFSYKLNIKDLEMVNEYFDTYKELLIYNENEAYQKLNSNYAKSRFGSKEAFIKYIENNKSNIALMKINQYRVYSSDNYTDYICTDQYNNYYIFRQQDGIMRYTVFLDIYTVELDTFKEEYNNSKDDESKLSIQLGKITQMLNNKDYNAIYNKLNETFRNNNYTNVSSLEEYLKNNIYNINSVVISDYEKNDDYYVCKATIQNQKNTNESKDMNLIIKLIDSNNFEMSFSFN